MKFIKLILVILGFSLSLFSEAQNFIPIWTNPYNPMTFYVLSATFDGTDLQAGDEIGIFDIDPITGEDICVGAGTLIQPLVAGEYLELIASMDDGTNPDQANGFTPGNSFIFMLYSQTNGLAENVEYTFPYPGYDEVFASQGSAFVELSASITPPQQQSFELLQGWTAISSYLLPQNPDIVSMFDPVSGQLIILQNQSGVYYPAGSINTLQNWDETSGYLIKMESASTFDIQGYNIGNKTLNLNVGWNLIPVMVNCPVDIETLFSGFLPQMEIIKEPAGLGIYWPGKNIFSITELQPGKAYLVKMNQAVQITFPDCP